MHVSFSRFGVLRLSSLRILLKYDAAVFGVLLDCLRVSIRTTTATPETASIPK